MWQQRRGPANHRNIFSSLNWTIEDHLTKKTCEDCWRIPETMKVSTVAIFCIVGLLPVLSLKFHRVKVILSSLECCEELFFFIRSWHWCDYKETQIKFIWKCWLYDVITNGRFFGQTGWQRRLLQQFPSNTAGGKTIKIYCYRLFMLCLTFLNANNISVNFVCVHMFSMQCDHDRFLFGEESKCQSFTVEVIVIKIFKMIIAVINCRHDHHSV